MAEQFRRCPLCAQPHELGLEVCPVTGQRIPDVPPLPPPPRSPRALPSIPALAPPKTTPSTPAVPLSDRLVGTLVDKRYRVNSVIARGGMGVVYEVIHEGLGRRLALKALSRRCAEDPRTVRRFRNEARIASALGHPNIIEVFDTGTLPDGAPYLVMERLDGETLAQRLRREHQIPLRDVVEIGRQVLSALAATHEHGVLHRDLKPENIFLVEQPGMPALTKVLDFGISKIMDRTVDDGSTLTRTGFVMGTPAYMAPEQARGERDLDGRVDLYAVGVLLYEMLVGHAPYLAKNPAALIMEMQSHPPEPPRVLRPAVPAWLDLAVLTLLNEERERRYPDAQVALAALDPSLARLEDQDPTLVTGPPSQEPEPPRR